MVAQKEVVELVRPSLPVDAHDSEVTGSASHVGARELAEGGAVRIFGLGAAALELASVFTHLSFEDELMQRRATTGNKILQSLEAAIKLRQLLTGSGGLMRKK